MIIFICVENFDRSQELRKVGKETDVSLSTDCRYILRPVLYPDWVLDSPTRKYKSMGNATSTNDLTLTNKDH